MFDTIDYNHAAPADTLGCKVATDTDNVVEALLGAGVPFAAPVKAPMATIMPDGSTRVVPHRFNLVDSTGRVVGENVTERYEPIGFGEQLSVLDAIRVAGTSFNMDRVVEFDGRRIFFSVRLDGLSYDATGTGDEVTPYLWMRGSHDSSCATQVFISLRRAHCTNQLATTKTLAKRMGLPFMSVRHTKSAHDRLRLAGEIVANCEEIVMTQRAIMQGLAATPFSSTDFANFVDVLMPAPPEPMAGQPTRGYTKAMNRRELLFDLYEYGRGAHSGRGTKWQALNAVTEYTTHHIATRGGDREQKLFLSTIEGPAARLNEKALALLTA